MSLLKKFAAATAAALRKSATGAHLKQEGARPVSRSDTPATAAGDSPAAAAGDSKPYRITFRDADGNLVSKPATAEEALAYANNARQWRRIRLMHDGHG